MLFSEISSQELVVKSSGLEELQTNNQSGRVSKEGSEASDIERISDDGLTNYPMDASAISHISTFSLISVPGGHPSKINLDYFTQKSRSLKSSDCCIAICITEIAIP